MGTRREEGQALVLAMGGVFVLLAGALALVAIAGAVTGKGRVQRAADLAAISAARSMRDDLPRLLSPPALPNGLPNPRHIEKAVYLSRARAAAQDAAEANGVSPVRLLLSFPDQSSFAPVRVKALVVADLDVAGGRTHVEASAIAEAAAPATASGSGVMPAMASGGGYSGPLVYRSGEGMRPDVGAAFDRMAAAARSAGLTLIVNSGFRSDAEQAALFAANPDPRWVAPPGQSLHRCATELDLGPETAYGWLAANASRFGFLQRYSWVLRAVSEGLTSRRHGRFLQAPLRAQRTDIWSREGVQSSPPGSPRVLSIAGGFVVSEVRRRSCASRRPLLSIIERPTLRTRRRTTLCRVLKSVGGYRRCTVRSGAHRSAKEETA